MRKTIILAALSAAISTPAHADTLKANYPVCVTQDLLDQMYDAILKKDMMAMDYLFDHGCVESKKGVLVSVIGRSSWGTAARIRIYGNKVAVEAWASIAAIEVDSATPSSAR